jgi:hypothetical protein
MADKSDIRPASDGADWAFLALTPVAIAALMLATAAVFATETGTPVALVEQAPGIQAEAASN